MVRLEFQVMQLKALGREVDWIGGETGKWGCRRLPQMTEVRNC